jgi:hypothetical protein
MEITLTSPRTDAEVLQAFRTASALRFAGETAAMEEALVACTDLRHAGWDVLALVRCDDEPVGWVGWVPVLGGRWCSLLQVTGAVDALELAGPLLCWLAHTGDKLRAGHGAGVLESLFTPWEDKLAAAVADQVSRHQWDSRRAGPTWSSRYDLTVRGPVEVLTWSGDPLPHRCRRRRSTYESTGRATIAS